MPLAVIDLFAPETLPMMLRIMLVAVLVNVSCALVGSLLVLRRMSLMGDALSHAVLPGLVLAFMFSGSLSIVPMFIGAVLAGVATTFLTQTLHHYGKLSTDAAMGVVFTSLFALGVVLLKLFGSRVHLDIACVFEGSLVSVLDTIRLGGVELPRQILVALPVLLVNAGAIMLLWKELKITTFDSSLATSMGISSPVVHYTLMTLVALTAVASFQVVGSILVIAMLIIPPAAAQLCVERMGRMVMFACAIGAGVGIVGTLVAMRYDLSPPGVMSVMAGGVYLLAAIFSPTGGVVARAWFNHQTASRIVREDVLAMLYRVEETSPKRSLTKREAIEAVGGGLAARGALRKLIRQGEVLPTNGNVTLTHQGRTQAMKLVRTHRLWETYLHEELGLPLDHVHEPAHRVEHYLDEKIQEQLASRLAKGAGDPHGREIPE